MNTERNIKIFKVVKVLGLTSFWGPAFFLFFTTLKGFSAAEALSVTSIYSIAIVFFEIPTGIVSDVFSRKLSLALGTAIKGLAIFLMVFAPAYWVVFLLALLMAIGESLISGSDTSILYDTLIVAKKESDYKKIVSNAFFYVQIYMGFCALASGFLGEINLALPLIVSLPFYLLASFAAWQFEEPDNISNLRNKKELTLGKQLKNSITSLYIVNGKADWSSITLTLAHFFIMGFISTSIFWIVTPIFDNFGVGIAVIGTLTMAFRLAKSFGSWLFTKIDDKNDMRAMKLSVIGLAVLILGMILFQNIVVTVILYGLTFIIQVFYQYNYNQYTNNLFKSEYRATLNSVQSMAMRLWAFIMLPIFGYLMESVSYEAAMGLLLGSLVVGLGLLEKKR